MPFLHSSGFLCAVCPAGKSPLGMETVLTLRSGGKGLKGEANQKDVGRKVQEYARIRASFSKVL